MSSISATKTINAGASAVWDVLADFGNIADWTEQVQASHTIGDPITGVGQGRHCQLGGSAAIDETITEYVPERQLGISIHNTKKIPIKSSISSFTLNPTGPNTTEVTMTASPTFKGGPAGVVLKTAVKGKLRQGLADLLDDLAVASVKQAKAGS